MKRACLRQEKRQRLTVEKNTFETNRLGGQSSSYKKGFSSTDLPPANRCFMFFMSFMVRAFAFANKREVHEYPYFVF